MRFINLLTNNFCFHKSVIVLHSPVLQVANEIVDVVNVHPAVDIHGTCCYGNQHHQCQFDHMAELHKHDGCY